MKISSLHNRFSFKKNFLNGDKFTGIWGLVQINKWNSYYNGKHNSWIEKCLFCMNLICFINLICCDIRHSTKKRDTFPGVWYQNRKMPWIYEVGFITKHLLNYWKFSYIKNHTNLETKIISRSSRQRCSTKKKLFLKFFTGKHVS